MNEKDLFHYGIKGMRWGIVRKRGKDGRVSSDAAEAYKLKGKKISELSNQELQQLNTRMQLERTQKDLRSKDISPGKKFVQNQGSQLLSRTVQEVAKGVSKAAVSKIMGDD